MTGAKAELNLRPNAATELYLWVLNPKEGDPAKDREEFTVEMEAARGGPVARTKVVIPSKTWVRVRLLKPPAPTPPPAAVPPPATPAAPAAKAPAEPPPPGAELPLTGGKTIVTFRLLDGNGKVFLDTAGNNKPYGNDFTVSLRPLSDYVGAPDVKITPGERDVRITATVSQKPFEYPGSVPIQLIIPPQPALGGAGARGVLSPHTGAHHRQAGEGELCDRLRAHRDAGPTLPRLHRHRRHRPGLRLHFESPGNDAGHADHSRNRCRGARLASHPEDGYRSRQGLPDPRRGGQSPR